MSIRLNNSEIVYFTQDELKRLISSITDKRDKALFVLAYRYGLRASEVGLLRRVDLDFKSLRIKLRRVKRGLGGEYPLDPDAARHLKSYLRTRQDDSPILFPSNRNQPISRQQLHVLMRKYCKLAGIPEQKAHFHVLRHTCGTQFYSKTGDIHSTRDRLGHVNIQNTVGYAQVTNPVRDEAGRKFAEKDLKF
jgi:integrase